LTRRKTPGERHAAALTLLEAVRQRPTVLFLYATVAIQTLLFQAFIRLYQCTGFGPCAVSLAKGVVWSVVWPAYWFGYFFLF
jgi:hypothetical protein